MPVTISASNAEHATLTKPIRYAATEIQISTMSITRAFLRKTAISSSSSGLFSVSIGANFHITIEDITANTIEVSE